MADVRDEPRKGWAQASLRIFSDSVTFEWISEQLELDPDHGGNAGEPGPGTSIRRSTLWVLTSRLSSEHLLDEHIQHLLSRLQSRLVGLAAVAEECRMELFAGVFADDGQISETVPWETLRTLGDRHIDLDLDLYPAEAPEALIG